MQVRELIKLLQAQKDLDAEVRIKVGSPISAAWSKAEMSVETDAFGVTISAYASSDDPEAVSFFPGLAEEAEKNGG